MPQMQLPFLVSTSENIALYNLTQLGTFSFDFIEDTRSNRQQENKISSSFARAVCLLLS
jgi:hypothetical protein